MSQQEDERYMRLALEEAQLAYESGEIPIGAVVVCDGRVIARAHNEVERLSDPTAHAEVLAVTAATQYMRSKFLGDCRLYVTIEPCTMCAGALHWARLDAVDLHGRAHHLMQADLSAYPPMYDPEHGLVTFRKAA